VVPLLPLKPVDHEKSPVAGSRLGQDEAMSAPMGASSAARPRLHQLTTPRAAAMSGVIFALLFGAVLILIRTKMPEGVGNSTE
jgi:hypothetical protein